MKFSVCTDAVLNTRDTETQRLMDIKSIGATAFEFWKWWDKDSNEINRAKAAAGIELAAICTKFISLTDPGKREEYKKGLIESLEAAAKMNCKMIISQVGDDTGADRALQHQSIIDGLRECVPLLEKAGVTLVIEPLNTRIDHKGYYLWQSSEAFRIVETVASRRVKVLYDIYHMQIMEGNIINTITANIDRIGHFHAAGLPGRNELQSGELNYPFIFSAIEKTGYTGYIGLEYFPKQEPLGNLKKILEQTS